MKNINEFKELKDLNLMDRFLFAQAIEDKEVFEAILEIILGKDVALKAVPQAESEKRGFLWYKHIKLDVYGIDEDDTVYNAEVQKRNTYNLPRRSRLYNSIIDSRLLPSGTMDFNKLNDVYVIMIMPFDLFGEGRYKYTFKMKCEESEGLGLEDGATRIFLNTKGRDRRGVSDELIELLKYFEETTKERAEKSGSKRIHLLQEKIDIIRESDEIGVKYMNAWEERMLEIQDAYEQGEAAGIQAGKAAGIAEGIQAGKAAGLEEGINSGIAKEKLETARRMKAKELPYELISSITDLSVNDIKEL